MPEYDARLLKRRNRTQRRVDEDRNHVRAMVKALNEKTRLEIALIKYLEKKGVSVEETRAALESVKTAQADEHFHLLWNLLEKPYVT
jgi:hypothetical protein